MARIFWTDRSGRHPTKSVHLYPNESSFTIRLDDPATVFTGVEPGKGRETGAPWSGSVTQFRLDPNQDHAGRCWTIGRVWLTADEDAGAVASIEVPPTTLASQQVSTTVSSTKVARAKRGGRVRTRAFTEGTQVRNPESA